MEKQKYILIAFVIMIALALFTINIHFITPAHAETKHDAVFFVGKTTYQNDGKVANMDVAPYTASNRTYVPVRYLAESLGMTVDWEPNTQTTILKGSKEIKLVINNKTMLVNGKPVKMDVAPVVYKGRTMLPARWVAEAEGYRVYWFEKLKTVHVWPVVYVEGGWRVPKENIHPITSYMKIYMNHKDAEVETVAGKYTVKEAFSVPYNFDEVPLHDMFRIFGFPVDYNLEQKGNEMTIYGEVRKAHIAIGSKICNERNDWWAPFGNDWVTIREPYRASNGEWMVQHGVVLFFNDILFGTGCGVRDDMDSRNKAYTEFFVDTNPS